MNFVVLDFETTGSQPSDAIIQVGIVLIDDHKITKRYSTFINPGIVIPSFITQLTGITDDTVKNAPSIEAVVTEILPFLKDRILIGHHISFDLGFLQRALD